MSLTVTEALAELKTIDKRLASKAEVVGQNLMRQRSLKDPHEKDGGSVELVRRERQAIRDLSERKVALRLAIMQANAATMVTVGGVSRSIAGWLTWRRDVAPFLKENLQKTANFIQGTRKNLLAKGFPSVPANAGGDNPDDILVNINERELGEEIESMETTLGTLDGQLSLKNATIVLEL